MLIIKPKPKGIIKEKDLKPLKQKDYIRVNQ